jgi:aminopeptidase N
MVRFRTLIVLVVCVFGMLVHGQEETIGDESANDPYFDDLGNGGYDVLHYDIHITSDFPQFAINGDVQIRATATQDLTQFNLDFAGFQVREVRVNDAESDFERDARELTIIPTQAIATGDEFVIDVVYDGIPRKDIESDNVFAFSYGWNQNRRGVFVASEPDGASLWFPCNDHPSDKATFNITVTVPTGYTVASNGLLENISTEDEQTTFEWGTEYPMATYLATVHIGEFVIQEGESGNGVKIRNYFPIELAPQLEELFSRQGEMLDFFESLFGDYPFEAYGVAVTDANLPYALETQTLSLFGKDILRADQESADNTIAHELAHQWFGNSITPKTWRDIWLNEGFATYLAALWLEHTDGREAYDELMENYYAVIAQPNAQTIGNPLSDPEVEQLFGTLVYLRGAYVLHELRLLLGDEVFFQVMRGYYQRFEYSNASIEDFMATASDISGKNLTIFFKAWLFSPKIPK